MWKMGTKLFKKRGFDNSHGFDQKKKKQKIGENVGTMKLTWWLSQRVVEKIDESLSTGIEGPR